MNKLNLLGRYLPLFLLATSMTEATAQERPAPERGVRVRDVIVRPDPDEPKPETLPASPEPRCDAYARSAVADFRTMQRFPACLIRDSARWQPDYQAHYRWCAANLAPKPEWIAAESKARNDHLVKCGVRKNY